MPNYRKSCPAAPAAGQPKGKRGPKPSLFQIFNFTSVHIEPEVFYETKLCRAEFAVVAVGVGDVFFHKSSDVAAGRRTMKPKTGQPAVRGDFAYQRLVAEQVGVSGGVDFDMGGSIGHILKFLDCVPHFHIFLSFGGEGA
jgi:hypothetical protein